MAGRAKIKLIALQPDFYQCFYRRKLLIKTKPFVKTLDVKQKSFDMSVMVLIGACKKH